MPIVHRLVYPAPARQGPGRAMPGIVADAPHCHPVLQPVPARDAEDQFRLPRVGHDETEAAGTRARVLAGQHFQVFPEGAEIVGDVLLASQQSRPAQGHPAIFVPNRRIKGYAIHPLKADEPAQVGDARSGGVEPLDGWDPPEQPGQTPGLVPGSAGDLQVRLAFFGQKESLDPGVWESQAHRINQLLMLQPAEAGVHSLFRRVMDCPPDVGSDSQGHVPYGVKHPQVLIVQIR